LKKKKCVEGEKPGKNKTERDEENEFARGGDNLEKKKLPTGKRKGPLREVVRRYIQEGGRSGRGK